MTTKVICPFPDRYVRPIIDLTSASVDYDLSVGETANITITTATSVPLNIAVSGTLYEITVQCDRSVAAGAGAVIVLEPNNTTYTSAFADSTVYHTYGASATGYENTASPNAFNVSGSRPALAVIVVSTTTTDKSTISQGVEETNAGTYDTKRSAIWADTTTVWTSLGTIVFPFNVSGVVTIVRKR